MPVYNNLNIWFAPNSDGMYSTQSKSKFFYEAGLNFTFNKLRLGFGASYFQSEFTGPSFWIPEDTYEVQKGYVPEFYIKQKTNYSFYTINLFIGYAKCFKERHTFIIDLGFLITTKYNICVSNYYDGPQNTDTSKYELARNVKTDKNFGLNPKISLSLGYAYLLNKRLALNISLLSFFSYSNHVNSGTAIYDGVYKYDLKSKAEPKYYLCAYNVSSQIFVAPRIGIIFFLINKER